ncbi:MBG domain-containing protein [Algoriphagus aquimarinus]|nr:MBG domain-containing protein [Algoriphagus aquimarinus]
MERPVFKLVFCLFLFICSTAYSFSQTTVNFNSYTENQGLSTPHVEGELEFEVIKGPAATCVNCMGIDINEGKDGGPGLDDANFELEGIKGWKISKADNSSFQFISIWLQERGLAGISTSGTIKAFSGGLQVGSTVNIDFNSSTAGLKSFSSNPDFYNVDEVRIEGVDLYIILDEITYGVPFVVGDADPAEVTAINLIGSPLSTATSVQYQVDFSKIAQNVSSDDFTLTKTGTANGTIGTVTGSNATYTVPISGISGEGTLRLDLKVGTDITNENGVDGTAAFTSGQVHNVSPCLVEDFEDETVGAKVFSYGGFDFTITGNLEVYTETPSIGINGSKNVLKNTGTGTYTIRPNSGEINFRKIALFLSSIPTGDSPTNDGNITVVGKNGGATVYTISKASGFPTDFSANSGYYILDLKTEGGVDNSVISVDEIDITLGGSFQYLNVDNFEFCADDVAPSGYSVTIDQDPITPDNDDAVSFTFAGAEVGTTYEYIFTSSGGGTPVTNTGTIITATDQITGIDLTGLGLGTITLSVNLTDASNNEGLPAQDQVVKRVLTPPVATPPTAPVVTEDDVNVALADDIQVADADGDDQTITFTITGGTVTLGTAGITFGGSGNGAASFTAAGTLAALNTALDAATFTPTPSLVGTDAGTIAFVSNDGTDDSNTASVTFDIAPSNNPPIAQAKDLYANVQGNCVAPIPAIAFNNNSSDPDGDDLTFTAIPAGPYPVGVTQVILSVSDGVLTTQADPVTITVYSDAPTIDGITPGVTFLSVDFTSGSLGGPAISNYEYTLDNGANWITPNPSQTSSPILIEGLTSSTTYQVQLRAVNDQGVSCESNISEGTTLDPIQLDITLTPNQSKVFGTGDPVLTYSATGFQDGDTEALLTGSLGREAGENAGLYSINQGDLDAGLKYTIVFTAADFEITALEVNVTAQTDTKDYDGTNSSSLSPVGDVLQGTDAWISEGTQSYDDENVGTGKTITAIGASIEDGNGGANYNINYVTNSEGVINKIDATLTVTRAGGDYDGNPFEATGTVTGLEGALSPSVTFEYEKYDGSNWAGIAGAPTDAGAYRVRSNFAGNTNYNAGSSDWTAFAINQIAATITVTRASGDYDGNPFEATGSATGLEGALIPAVTFEYEQNDGSNWAGISGAPTDAGAYRVRSNFAGNTNYNAGFSDWTAFAINQIAATITVTRASGDYDGNPFVATGSATGLEGDLSPLVTFEYEKYDGSTWAGIAGAPTDAGAYRVRSNFAGNTNYNAGSSDWTAFAINQIAATITVTRAGGDYDGNPFVATGSVTGLEGDLSPPVTFEYQENDGSNWTGISGAPTDAGDYRVRSNFAGNTNYNSGSSDWTAFAINQIAATITVTRAGGDYNGNPFVATGSVTGLEGALSPAVTIEYQEFDGSTWSGIAGAPTDAGAYRVRSNFAGNTNYNAGSSDWTAFAINKIAATITVTRAGGDYDGNPFVATGSVTGLEGDLIPSVTFEYEQNDGSTWSGIAGAPTDAGAYRVRSNFAGNTNYNAGSSDWTAFAINKIDATITVTGYAGTYDGAAHGATGSAKGLAGEILAGLNLGVSFTNVPGGTAYWTFTDVTGNYNDDNDSVVIGITMAPTTITISNALANCDGGQVTLTATVKTVNTGIQSDVNSLGGVVTFKTGGTTIGTVNVASVTDGVFSGTFTISLTPGSPYPISAEFEPVSGNLIRSETTETAQLTVFEAFVSSSIPKNANGNVVIFDGAESSLGLPSSTTLTTTYQPSPYSGLSYQWYERNEGGSFTLISGAEYSTFQIVANGDFVKDYKVELIVDGQCVGNEIFSKVISVEASCGKAGQNNVQVCRIMPNGKRKTMCISANAVEALLAVSPGSYIGSCNVTYRMEEEPELIAVPWNTPLEVINDKIVSQSENWFDSKKIKLTINTESYNALQPGFYEMKVDLQENEWFELEEPITVNVLVADKPLATDIQLSNSILLRNIHNGSLIGDLRTIDPVDDQHTYSIAEHTNFEIRGKSLIWKGTAIPATARITVFSTDRAGQTIERAIELSREPRFGEFKMFPNPSSSEVNLEVELEQSMNVGIRIYDAVGRLVYQEEGVQNGIATYQIAIDHLSPGLYTVQMKTGILVMNKRLIKK